MYTSLVPPASLGEALQAFWFDVTKSDWRSTMIMGVDESALRPRLAMYWFDVTQQFGETRRDRGRDRPRGAGAAAGAWGC